MIKSVIKKYVPNFLIRAKSRIKNRMLKDVYSKKHSNKKVLISYIVSPFRSRSHSHTNNYEVVCAAKIFDELGYRVDVVNYDGVIPALNDYDVIYGFGDVFKKYFEGDQQKAKTIYYSTGMHVCYQNTMTLLRAKDFYKKKKKWALDSARFVEKTWSHQSSLVDAIIALGNKECANSFRKFFHEEVYELDAPFFKFHNALEIIERRNKDARKSFLWIGSSGAIHKGLDLCLDYFSSRKDLSLHICGLSKSERVFLDSYRLELNQSNIINHGFVDIKSSLFAEILKSCSFVIFPSCSEGGAASVITAVGNGALIPIVSKGSSVTTGYEIELENLNVDSINKAVLLVESYSDDQLIDLQSKNLSSVLKKNNIDIYYQNLKQYIEKLVR